MLDFNQYVFCLLDRWYGLSLEDIRNIEADFKDEAERILSASLIEDRERTPTSIRSE